MAFTFTKMKNACGKFAKLLFFNNCQICKFVMFLSPSSSCCLSSIMVGGKFLFSLALSSIIDDNNYYFSFLQVLGGRVCTESRKLVTVKSFTDRCAKSIA